MRYVPFGSLHMEDENIGDCYEVAPGEAYVLRRPTKFWTTEQEDEVCLIRNQHKLGAQHFESNKSIDR